MSRLPLNFARSLAPDRNNPARPQGSNPLSSPLTVRPSFAVAATPPSPQQPATRTQATRMQATKPQAAKTKRGTALLIIDPQYDFCSPFGSLYVDGAEQDCIRLAKLVDYQIKSLASSSGAKGALRVDDIIVTLDTHHPMHIAHPSFWVNNYGEHPDPFTCADFTNETGEQFMRTWYAASPADRDRASEYLLALAERGGVHTIWPEHCIEGSLGHAVHPILGDALREWSRVTGKDVIYVRKGSFRWSEHFSAVRAEVEFPDHPETQINKQFVQQVLGYERVFVAGEALSHCVSRTVQDLVDRKVASQAGATLDGTEFILIENMASPVSGFEGQGENFVAWCKRNGVGVKKYSMQ